MLGPEHQVSGIPAQGTTPAMDDMSGWRGGLRKTDLTAPVHIAVSIGEAGDLRQAIWN